MILRFILHIEWHRGYNHNLPRVSIKRAPYPGKVEYTRGWGWRKLVPCRECSAVGYFDAPLNYSGGPTWIEQNHAVDEEAPFPAPSEPVYAQFIDDEDVAVAEGRGAYRASESLGIDEDRDYCRWDNEGGNGHNRG